VRSAYFSYCVALTNLSFVNGILAKT